MWLANKVSFYNRQRKWNLFLREIAPVSSTHILDVGFSEEDHMPTQNFIEKNYSYPEMLTALGIEVPVEFSKQYPKVKAVHYDGTIFPFADQSFDVCWSNAVIEHVGDRSKQVIFLKEAKRVSRRAFITTPNKFFPIEVHTLTPFLHFLPKAIFDKYLVLIGKEWATGNYMNLLSISNMKNLLAEANITKYKIVENKLAGFTLDFVVLF
jgi:SAM-dependent methyltransferase